MLQDFSNFIATQIKILITAITVTVIGLLPQTGASTDKPVDTSLASPSAIISVSPNPSPTIKPTPRVTSTKKPTPIPTSTPFPQPSRVSVLLVNDGTTVYCLTEWADEVKRAAQGVKDAEEVINKLSDCTNSCSNSSENSSNECRTKYPTPPGPGGISPPEQIVCFNKVNSERASCLSNCPRPSSGVDTEIYNLQKNREKSKKFLGETRGEHCTDSK